jgi:hypothetical protein
MAAPSFFNTTEPVDGIVYYIIPVGTHLFRGDIPANYNRPLDHISGPVFFGQTADVALTYGIPFEYVTKSEMRLLALDQSMEQIYNNALNDKKSKIEGEPVNVVIPSILKRNYGYINGIRNSDDAADKKLTKYICERYPGYATDFMETDFGGVFHREIVICDKNSVDFVQKLTQVDGKPVNDGKIIADQNLRRVAQEDAKERAQKKQRPNISSSAIQPPIFGKKLFDVSDEDDSMNISTSAIQPQIFGNRLFDDSDEEGGGKSRKIIKSHKRLMRNKRRKTHKRGKPKKATHKRK